MYPPRTLYVHVSFATDVLFLKPNVRGVYACGFAASYERLQTLGKNRTERFMQFEALTMIQDYCTGKQSQQAMVSALKSLVPPSSA